MRKTRAFLPAVAAVLLLLSGCDDEGDDSSSGPDLTGEWIGTWTDSESGSGTLRIVLHDGGAFPIEVFMGSAGCGSGVDYLLSQSGPFATNGDITFTVGNCDCIGGFGCLFAGGIFTFKGTYGQNQMQGTYAPQSLNCDCCSCMSNQNGTWEVSR